jgi:flagella basal body P-ring formation protein FlgA
VDKSLRFLFFCAGGCWLLAAALALLLLGNSAWADDLPLAEQVRQLALDAGQRALPTARVEVEVGQLDPRLHLAPCERVQPYLPAGSKPWGKTRVGLRCVQGPTAWNVYLPVTVKVFGRALVAASALPAGVTLAKGDVREDEVDLAAAGAAVTAAPAAVGRTLSRALNAGDPLRQSDLKPRQYFATGQTVQIVAVGSGYQVSSEGQALTPGLEGQMVRVRTDSGRVVTGQAVAEHRVEIAI